MRGNFRMAMPTFLISKVMLVSILQKWMIKVCGVSYKSGPVKTGPTGVVDTPLSMLACHEVKHLKTCLSPYALNMVIGVEITVSSALSYLMCDLENINQQMCYVNCCFTTLTMH